MPDILDSIFAEAKRAPQSADPLDAVMAEAKRTPAPPQLPKPPLPPGLRGKPLDVSSNAWTDAEAEGVHQGGEMMVSGVREAGEGIGQVAQGVRERNPRMAAGGASKAIRGAGKAAWPVAAVGAALNPPAALAGIAAGMAVQEGTERGLRAAGAPEEYAALAGDVAGALPVIGGAKAVVNSARRSLAPPPLEPLGIRRVPPSEPASVPIPDSAPTRPTPDAGPVPKGPQIKSARESAEVFAQMPAPKDAAASAAVFERAAAEQARKSQKQVAVPETGVPENVARAVDSRQRIAQQVANKPWEQLDNSERIVIDALVAEGNIGATASRRSSQRGSLSLKPGETPAAPTAPEPDDLLNYRRLGLSEAGYKLLQNQTDDFQAKTGYEKPHTTFSQVESRAAEILPELEKRLNVPTQEQILTDQGTALAARRALTTLSNETARLTERLRDRASMRPSEAAGLETQLATYRKDMQDMIGKVTRIRTKAGQDLAFWRIVAEESKDPWDAAQWSSRVQKMHGDAEVPSEVSAKLHDLLDQGRAAEQAAVERVRGGKQQASGALPTSEQKVARAVDRSVRNAEQRLAEAQGTADPKPPGKWALTDEEKKLVAADQRVREAKHNLAKFLAEQQRMGVLETVSYLVRGGLLTGPGGAMRDIVGTGLNQALEEAARVPSSIIDSMLAMRTGNRTTSGMSWEGFAESVKASGQGVKQIPTLVKHGVPDSALAKLEAVEKAPAKFIEKSPITKAWFNLARMTYRVRGAIDAPSYEFALRRALYSQAQAEAKNAAKNLEGGAQARFQRDFVRDYVSNPSEAAMTQAVAAAEFATFRNETTAYKAIRGGRKHLGSVGQFAMDMIIPFTRATTAIGYRTAEYAGGGIAEGSVRLIKAAIDGELKPEQQKLASEAIGRGLIGPAMAYVGYVLAQNGVLTGTSQETEGARERDTAAGRTAMSLKVGDQWLQIGGIAPIGNLLVLGATLQREGIRPLRDEGKRPDVVLGAGARTVLEQPYFQGAEEFIDFIKSPSRNAGRMAASKAGMAVPTIVGNIAEATDDVQRERSRESIPSQVMTGLQSRIPGARQMMPPRLDVLSRPVPSAGASALSPFRASTAKTDAASRAIVRDQVSVSRTDKKPSESESEYRLRAETQGLAIRKALDRATASSGYRRLESSTEDERRDFLKKQVDQARDRVNNLTSSKRYQRMPEQDRIRQLTTLKQRIERAR